MYSIHLPHVHVHCKYSEQSIIVLLLYLLFVGTTNKVLVGHCFKLAKRFIIN